MTKKHFIEVARILAEHVAGPGTELIPAEWLEGYEGARLDIARALADAFEQANPNFDRQRFLAAAKAEVMT